jgi:hypothetical protein
LLLKLQGSTWWLLGAAKPSSRTAASSVSTRSRSPKKAVRNTQACIDTATVPSRVPHSAHFALQVQRLVNFLLHTVHSASGACSGTHCRVSMAGGKIEIRRLGLLLKAGIYPWSVNGGKFDALFELPVISSACDRPVTNGKRATVVIHCRTEGLMRLLTMIDQPCRFASAATMLSSALQTTFSTPCSRICLRIGGSPRKTSTGGYLEICCHGICNNGRGFASDTSVLNVYSPFVEK